MRPLLAACLLGATVTPLAAQDLIWVAREFDNSAVGGTAADPFRDVTALTSAGTTFRIGNNPIAVAYDGTNLYLGGNVNGPTNVEEPPESGTFVDLTIEVAELSDFLINNGTAGAKEVLGSEIMASDLGAFSGRGFSGMDWDDRFGLLTTIDRGSTAGDQIFIFQRTNPGDFSATLQVSASGIQGTSGPAYDNGFDGLGFELSDSQGGPAAAVPIRSTGRSAGLDPLTFDPADDIYGETFNPNDNTMNPLYTIFTPESGTIWRDFDIHPTTGLVAARANNVVVLGDRTSTNGTTNLRSIIPPAGQGVAVNQNVEIIHSPPCGDDFIVMNSRAASGGFLPFTQTVLFYDIAGNPLTYEIRLPGGGLAPLDTGDPANIFSFFWHEPSGLLFVVDGQNRHVYTLELDCPSDCDGDVDG
ncbi:MAG: hypothetical protein AAFX05_10890, partial [Planctomycetota bacterium]